MNVGMWTKHLNRDGAVFLYNAAQSKSVWILPNDSVVLEPPNLQYFDDIDHNSSSNELLKSKSDQNINIAAISENSNVPFEQHVHCKFR